ncbi:MAG: glycosyltransferase family 4 protein, partial [Candidatus Omnitrophota bacterium]
RDAIERSCPQCRIQLPVIEREPAPDRYAHIREEKNTLLFFGHLRYFANEDAIKYFYKEIFHMVREKIPGVKLRIMGRGATPFMRRMAADPNVELIGYADDIIAELKKAALIIVPIRLGGGIRLKTLTAWKAGRAVISTSVGADGLPYKDGIDIAIADEPRDFSKKTIQLLNDDDLRKNIGEAGYANIQKNFNADKITSEIEGCYRGLIEGKGANEAR